MLELKDFMPVNFLKKEKFTGSFGQHLAGALQL